MKKINRLLLLILLIVSGCTNDSLFESDAPNHGKGTTFMIAHTGSGIEEVALRSLPTLPLKRLWYVVTNDKEQVIHPPHQLLSPDLSKLTIEGLRDGNYSILFLATTDDQTPSTIPDISDIAQQWLTNPTPGAPLDHDYLYQKLSFKVDKENDSRSIPVLLERNVGRVEVAIHVANPYSQHFIQKVEISYSDQSPVAQHQLASGSYGGSDVIRNFDITHSRGFYSLPGQQKLSGTVRVTALRSDGSSFVSSYQFSNSEISAGKISTIRIAWTHPEDKFGKFRVTANDFNPDNSSTLFYADPNVDLSNVHPNVRPQPVRALFDGSHAFHVDEPLQLSIDNKHRLKVRFYSALPIRDVTILCRFPRYSNEFFELAHYDEIPAFNDSYMPIPLVSGARVFMSESGRLVEIPAQPNLSSQDCELKFKTNDPYMAKIAEIAPHWKISFSHFQAQNNPGWLYMTPFTCRSGVVLVTNMAFMFSRPEFDEVMNKNINQLYDNDGKKIVLDVLKKQINEQYALNMGLCEGAQGRGGGYTYGLAIYRYTDQYWDQVGRDNIQTTPYHELAHCIGYGHSSNITQGLWPYICSQLMWDMGSQGKLLVNSKTVIGPNPTPQ